MNIQQVQIVSKPDTIDTFSFTITNAMPNMRWTHTSDDELFTEAKSVKIYMGYVDDLRKMIEGEITQIRPEFPADAVPTVTVEGHSLLHRLQGDNKTRTFQNVTDKQIVDQLARDAGLEVDAEDPDIQYEYVIQPNQTDLDFLRDRARRLHFEILVQDRKLIFRKSQENQTKTFTLLWAEIQKSVSAGPGTLPLKSCSLQMNTLTPPTNVEVRSYDPKSKKAFVSRAGSADQTSKMGGSQTGADVSATFQRQRRHVHVSTPFASQQECDQHARAAYNNDAMDLITGSAATIGAPDLCSGQVVELRGVGRRFDGTYLVDEATHSIGSDGYQTSLNLKRNAVS
ncbi:MAG TPA: contractile injection system protein, VgrG/Pvc8 family [Candidatus Angelobacter sp.]|nr:contractile injection system protein, VgrG/Pvc8 family [Candidatus Angelobacter sp.]